MQTHAGHSIAVDKFLQFATLWPWPFDLIAYYLMGEDFVMDYPCGKFGDYSFKHTDAAKRFTPATVHGVIS